MKQHKIGGGGNRIKNNPLRLVMRVAIEEANDKIEQVWELASQNCSESIGANKELFCGSPNSSTITCSFIRCPYNKLENDHEQHKE